MALGQASPAPPTWVGASKQGLHLGLRNTGQCGCKAQDEQLHLGTDTGVAAPGPWEVVKQRSGLKALYPEAVGRVRGYSGLRRLPVGRCPCLHARPVSWPISWPVTYSSLAGYPALLSSLTHWLIIMNLMNTQGTPCPVLAMEGGVASVSIRGGKRKLATSHQQRGAGRVT